MRLRRILMSAKNTLMFSPTTLAASNNRIVSEEFRHRLRVCTLATGLILNAIPAFAVKTVTAFRGHQVAANNEFPHWSHDGKKIVFTSDRDGDPEIYVMNADGSNPTRLTRVPGRDAHPFFSRDGRRIIFQSPRANGQDTNIYVMNSDGSNVVQLTNLKGFAGVPVYSPDERLIVLQWRETSNFRDGKKWRVCVMNDDGSSLRIITSGDANDQVPNWSHDGKRLLFYSDRTGKNQLYTMKADGSDVRRVTNTESNDQAATWSPDNKKIGFISDRDGNSEVYSMDANGRNVRRLTNTRATERVPICNLRLAREIRFLSRFLACGLRSGKSTEGFASNENERPDERSRTPILFYSGAPYEEDKNQAYNVGRAPSVLPFVGRAFSAASIFAFRAS